MNLFTSNTILPTGFAPLLRKPQWRHALTGAVAILASALSITADAAFPNLPTTPLAVQAVSDPNILLTLDDSGSMTWGYVPDSHPRDQTRVLAARSNPMAYNPFVKYDIPYDPALPAAPADPRLTTASSFTAALYNGFDASRGSVNLSTSYRPITIQGPTFTPSTYTNPTPVNVSGTVTNFEYAAFFGGPPATAGGPPTLIRYPAQAAFIYSFYSDLGPGDVLPPVGADPKTFVRNTTVPAGCPGEGGVTNAACYVKVLITPAHQTNFTTWFSFYRTRNLSVASSANIALYDLDRRYRVSWQTLNTCKDFATDPNSKDCKNSFGNGVANLLRPLNNDDARKLLFAYLSRLPATGSTPLRPAVQRAGQFITKSGINSSRANVLGTSETGPNGAPISACRANYHVMLTDGIWNFPSPPLRPRIPVGSPNPPDADFLAAELIDNALITAGDADNTAITLPDGTAYTPQAPFRSDSINSVADLAFKQWATDAQADIANNVIPFFANPATDKNFFNPRNDPATWQHMNTYAIGLGLSGSLNGSTYGATPAVPRTANDDSGYLPIWAGSTYAGDYSRLADGSIQWPRTRSDWRGNVADLWHAAINGRGEFYSADSPKSIRDAFQSILGRIESKTTSSGQVSSTSRRVNASSVAFDVTYQPGDWYATITARAVNADGTTGATVGSTDTAFTSDSPSRTIFTWDPALSTGRSFVWTSFTAPEKKLYFDTTALPDGDEDLLKYLRGDRANEGTKFRKRVQLLGDVVGSELQASAKTDQGYQFLPPAAGGSTYASFVRGKTSVVFAGSNDGMLHAFNTTGAEIFAYVPGAVLPKLKDRAKTPFIREPLVDGPLTLGDANLGGWKTILIGGLGGGGKSVFGLDVTGVTQSGGSGTLTAGQVLFEVTDPDMGFSFTKPVIGRNARGEWIAAWGNGYGGNSGRAVLFVYNLTTKNLSKVDTGFGSATVGQENGLGSPAAVEFSPGNIVSFYAGDYRGNMWKFSVSETTGAVSLGLGGSPLFAAKDSGGKVQPLTAAPEALRHPAGGVLVLFGTGKFFEVEDRGTRDVNTFYAVRDVGISRTFTRSNLVAQTITSGSAVDSPQRAVSTNLVDYNTKSGWFLDFTTTLGTSASGERIVARPILIGDLVAFATYTPGADVCQGTGLGYLMLLNSLNGGLVNPAIDTNNDGVIDDKDRAAPGAGNVAGIRISGDGSLSTPLATLISTQAFGNAGTAPPGATCGAKGLPPCPSNGPRPGCDAGLIVKGNVCVEPVCKPGNVFISGACTADPGRKFQRWMELTWK
jgi:type IV pilus assembly protein PilY1